MVVNAYRGSQYPSDFLAPENETVLQPERINTKYIHLNKHSTLTL